VLASTLRRQARERLLNNSHGQFTASGHSALETPVDTLEAGEMNED